MLEAIKTAISRADWQKLEGLLEKYADLNHHPWYLFAQGLYYLNHSMPIQAEAALLASTNKEPAYAQTWFLLAQSQAAQGKFSQSIPNLLRAVDLQPKYLKAWQALVQNLQHLGDTEVLLVLIFDILHPNWLNTINGQEFSELEFQAFAHWKPQLAALYLLNAVGSDWFSNFDLAAMVTQWQQRFLPPQPSAIHARLPDPNRRLKLAYFSNEWSAAPIRLGYHKLFQHHSDNFEIHALLDNSDAQIEELDMLHCFTGIHQTWPQDLTKLYQWLQEEAFDILISISGFFHPRGVQLLGMKPCPITVYTGSNPPFFLQIENVDLNFTDALIDPNQSEKQSFQKQYFPSFFRWQRPDKHQDLNPKQAQAQSMNLGVIASPNKLSSTCIKLWSQLLVRYPEAQLCFFNQVYRDNGLQKRILKLFEPYLIDLSCIHFLAPESNLSWYQGLKNFDLVLDTFPYGGALSTCDALWMNVPVLSLRGGRKIAESIMYHVNCPDFLAADEQDFMFKAHNICFQANKSLSRQDSLRQKLLDSDICNSEKHTRILERACREKWINWSAAQKALFE